MDGVEIGAASIQDAEAICAIYNPYVAETTISFEETPASPADMAQRIMDVTEGGLPWLVMCIEGRLAGYAYATKWRARPAYRHAVETTIYLDPHSQGRGHGALLYGHLLDELRRRGLHTAIAGIAQPNARSVALHERLGFEKVAHFSQVGFKLGSWVDVAYWQLMLDRPD